MNEKKEEVVSKHDAPTFKLADTSRFMVSADYKERFIAEYLQTKIRYEKLKAMTTKYVATIESCKDYLGFKPSCSVELLLKQQRLMGEYLGCLEQRAVVEGIELPNPYINC
jgi:hypothetical protein